MQKTNAPIFWLIVYTVISGLIFILGLNLIRLIPVEFRDIYKIGLTSILLIVYFVSHKYFPNHKAVFLAFFLVSLGWIVENNLTSRIVHMFSWDTQELSGFAYTMVTSTLLVSAPVIIGWLLAGQKLSTIYIQGSGKIWGIFLMVGLFLFGGLGVLQALSQGLAIELIGAAIPLALVFSLANGFPRGVSLSSGVFEGFTGKYWYRRGNNHNHFGICSRTYRSRLYNCKSDYLCNCVSTNWGYR